MSDIFFKKVKKDGNPVTCKFCRSPVWYHELENRVYDIGGQTLHVENCTLRQDYYRGEALNAAETRRKNR